jgi:hypothetical protein
MKIDFGSEEGGELINRAMRRSARQALWKHKQAGNSVAVSDENGNLKILQSDEIEMPDEFDANSSDEPLINRMTNDYCVNASIAYDLSDAREDLESIINLFQPNEKVDEVEFRVRMSHLSYHINLAWNKRNLTDNELELTDGKGLNRLAQFPLDITPL